MPTSLDEKIEQEALDEADARQQFEMQQQQDRLRVQQQRQNAFQKVQKVQDTVQKARKIVKRGKWLIWALQLLAATFPVWGPILLIILIFGAFVGGCNASTAFRIGSLGACEPFIFDSTFVAEGGRSGGAGASGTFDDLVSLLGLVNVDKTQASDPRVRQCMADVLVQLFNDAQSQGLDIVVTSAYRPGGTTAGGGTSAHSRGEAVDIALRNPTAAVHSNDPRIARLVAIARSVGFVPPAGDTLDEYARPAENASGGHVHVEFNIPSSGSYCDGTAL